MNKNEDASNIVRVPLDLGERAYDIVIGGGLLRRAAHYIQPALERPRTFIVSDSNVAPLYLETLTAGLEAAGIESKTHIVPAGDASKSWAELERLSGAILDAHFERDDMILALGGGMIGDLAGFAASIVRRGMRFIQIPTSLLAQVDSSVGGKTAINAAQGKNLIGSFYQPALVLADTDTLATLPQREFAAGFAEVIKYGAATNADFFTWLEDNAEAIQKQDRSAIVTAIKRSVEEKARIVVADERERGMRALLNFGHTFAHAFEKAAGFGNRVLHGEAVAVGMNLAARLSERQNLGTAQDTQRLSGLTATAGLPVTAGALNFTAGISDIMQAIGQDKKRKRDQLVLILWRGIGEAFVSRDVNEKTLHDFLSNEMTENED